MNEASELDDAHPAPAEDQHQGNKENDNM